MTKIIKALLLSLTLALTLAWAAPDARAEGELDKIKAAGKIRIGVFSDKPPFGYVDATGVNQAYYA